MKVYSNSDHWCILCTFLDVECPFSQGTTWNPPSHQSHCCRSGQIASTLNCYGHRLIYVLIKRRPLTCPLREGCYNPGSRTKTYSIRILSDHHAKQVKYEQTSLFQIRKGVRSRIEPQERRIKNSPRHDLGAIPWSLRHAITSMPYGIRGQRETEDNTPWTRKASLLIEKLAFYYSQRRYWYTSPHVGNKTVHFCSALNNAGALFQLSKVARL